MDAEPFIRKPVWGYPVPRVEPDDVVKVLVPTDEECEIAGLLRTFGSAHPTELARSLDDYEVSEVYPACDGVPVKRTF